MCVFSIKNTMEEYKTIVTVVTPTYNREKEINNLYNSLCMQTVQDFLWLIIDDGSTDNTEKFVKSLDKDSQTFQIKYIKKDNGGKHTALNMAFEIVNTELLFIVDSDDVLTSQAIEIVINDWGKYRDRQLCGISYLRGYPNGSPIGDLFPKDYLVDGFSTVRINRHIEGDKAEVWATRFLKGFRFPVFSDEKFIGENYIWIQVSKLANMLFRNKVIYQTQYLEGGLTKLGRPLRIKCPHGGMASSLVVMASEFNFKDRVKNGILYACYSFFAKISWREKYNMPYKGLLTLCMPFGFCLYLYWKNKYRHS